MKWLWLSVLTILLDQITKKWAQAELLWHKPLAIFPGFNLTLIYNKGAAFSFLSQADGWQRWFFIALSSVISIVLFFWLKSVSQQNNVVVKAAIALILGGAVGNLIDRTLAGQVTDFIQVYYASHYFPAFNIADSAITSGAGLLILDMFMENRKKKTHD